MSTLPPVAAASLSATRGSADWSRVSLVLGIAAMVAACAETAPDAASDPSAKTDQDAVRQCADLPDSISGRCAQEGECCAIPIPDAFEARGARCVQGKWQEDSVCGVAVCPVVVEGKITRADGKVLSPACVQSGPGTLADPGAAERGLIVSVDDEAAPGTVIEISFSARPAAGDTLTLVGDKAHFFAPDPGQALLQIVRNGGAGEHDVQAESASGTLLVKSVTFADDHSLTEVHLEATAELVRSEAPRAARESPWIGPMTLKL